MDPVTALQVAGSVVAFVDFSRTLIADACAVHKSPGGTSPQMQRLSQVISRLADYGEKISASLAGADPRGVSYPLLVDICRECARIKEDYLVVLRGLQASGGSNLHRTLSSIAAAFKLAWSQAKIDNLYHRLSQIQSEMIMIQLMAAREDIDAESRRRDKHLRHQSRDIFAAFARQEDKIDQIHEKMVGLTSATGLDGNRNRGTVFDDLWKADWQKGQGDAIMAEMHITNELDKQVQDQILSSLYFSSIQSREEAIPSAYVSTFEWIYHERAGTGFEGWLGSVSTDPYWITGKPGSGKSTLMKFITHHKHTYEVLKSWAGEAPLLVTHFFFWNAGLDDLQKSHEGLLRTLLYQALSDRPEMIPTVAPRRWAVHHAFRGQTVKPPPWDWTELEEVFSALAALSGGLFKLVLFIDGLDEFNGDPRTLITWVKNTTEKYKIKLCMGSRPWTAFSDAFVKYPSLSMQSLTTNDIVIYTDGTLESSEGFLERRQASPLVAEGLRQQILSRAEGVFLWVFLVLQQLQSAMAKGKTLADLQAIVDDLPGDLMQLYSRIYSSLEQEDAERAARYLFIKAASFVPLHAAILWTTEGEDVPAGFEEQRTRDALFMIVARRLSSSTRGILEMSAKGLIDYHHRSAREWLFNPDIWQKMTTHRPPLFDENLLLLQAWMKQLALQVPYHEPRDIYTDNRDYFMWEKTVPCFLFASKVADSPLITPVLIRVLEELRRLIDKEIDAMNATGRYKFGLTETRYVRDTYVSNHWSLTRSLTVHNYKTDAQDCFVGVMAQYGVVPFVKHKIENDRSLLKRSRQRRTLLENAVLGYSFANMGKEDVSYMSNDF